MSVDLKIIQTGERCQNLLSKGLYINVFMPPGEKVVGDGNFWCGRTQRVFGPDDQICDGENCTNTTRSCYQAP